MIHLFATLKGAVAMTAIAAGSYASGVLAETITQDSPVSLGAAVGVGAVVVLGAWYLSSRLQKIDDRLKSIESHINQCKFTTNRIVDK